MSQTSKGSKQPRTKSSRLANDPVAAAAGVTSFAASRRTKPVTIKRDRMRQTLFRPHQARATTRLMGRQPIVVFTEQAARKMGAYVGLMDDEIAWMSTVERPSEHLFVITDCFLFGQDVHATTAEIDPEKLGQLCFEILNDNPENGMGIVNSLKCWGHSHVNMGVSPSGQDDQQMEDFGQTVEDYMVRVIANKRGDVRVCIWDYAQGLIHEDLSWCFADAGDTDLLNEIADEIEQKVQALSFTSSTSRGRRGSGRSSAGTSGGTYSQGRAVTRGIAYGEDDALFADPEDTIFDEDIVQFAETWNYDLNNPAHVEEIADYFDINPDELGETVAAQASIAEGGDDALSDPWARDPQEEDFLATQDFDPAKSRRRLGT